MTRLVFTALALFAVAVGLLDLSARGTFAAASGPVAVAGQGPLLRVTPAAQRGAAGRGRLAIVVRAAPAEARKIVAALHAEGRAGITVTFALTALDVLADRELPLFIIGRGHDLAFAGYTDLDTTRLPEPIWTAETAVGQRFVESAAGREIRVYVPTTGGDLSASALETARRAERSGLVPLLPAPAPATRGDLDGLVLARDSREVEALLTALAAARANGVSVVPAATLAGIAPAPLPIPARLAGAAAFAGFDLWHALADVVVALAGLATLLMLVRLAVVAILATVQARRRVTSAGTVPTVAVLVAAYNEEVVIGSCVRSILTSDLIALQVVVVDDGSTDGTATAAAQAGANDPRFRVIRQPNAGKASALNAALAAIDAPVVVVMDADSILEREALRRLVTPFVDPSVGAVAGNVKVGNRTGWLGVLQHVEYVTGINLDRRFFDLVNAVSVVPGALGAFRRDLVVHVGGFPRDTLAEDADLTVSIGKLGYRVRTVADARVWTEVPATWRAFWKQRYRWSYGTLQVLWKHRDAPFRWRATNVGRLGVPYLIVFAYLFPLLGPAVDAVFLYGLLVGPQVGYLYTFGLFTALQFFAAALALRLDGEPSWHAVAVLGYQLGYRQMLSAVVASSLWAAFSGLPVGWGKLVRRGFAPRLG